MKNIKPMLANSVKAEKLSELYNSSDYIAEKKFDGMRYIAQITEEGVFLTSRRESVKGGMVDKTKNVPQIIEELKQLPVGTILDGEIDIPGDKSDFIYVQNVMGSLPERAVELQKNKVELVYKVFDVLELDKEELRNKNLKERKGALGWLFEQYQFNSIQLVEVYQGDSKEQLYIDEIKNGAEGIILKNLNSIYVEDKRPTKTWYKVKKASTYDGIVKGYKFGTPGTKYEKTLGTLTVYQYKNGQLIETGEISGLSEKEREEFKSRLDKGETFIIEFEAQETWGENRYRHPRFIRERKDKEGKDCIYGNG